jgi:hypothetical protein
VDTRERPDAPEWNISLPSLRERAASREGAGVMRDALTMLAVLVVGFGYAYILVGLTGVTR